MVFIDGMHSVSWTVEVKSMDWKFSCSALCVQCKMLCSTGTEKCSDSLLWVICCNI